MTSPDVMIAMLEKDMLRYERTRRKPRKELKWSRIKRNGMRIPLREPIEQRQGERP